MFEYDWDFLTGVMVGIEFPDIQDEEGNDVVNEHDDTLTFAMVIDLFIIRFIVFKWKSS